MHIYSDIALSYILNAIIAWEDYIVNLYRGVMCIRLACKFISVMLF